MKIKPTAFLLKKNIDWSFLVDGLTIPLEFIPILYSQIGTEIRVGESREIKILIDNQLYDATLKNINFSRSKYKTHRDILQIRYSKNSPIARRFQSITKQLFKNRCQITGETVGDIYGNPAIEAHHIQYFTESINNDTSNIIIINPNFHRIIHKNKPDFNRMILGL